MKNLKKKIGLFVPLFLGAILLSGCTASFCSTSDQAEILYPYDQGVTVYCLETEVPQEYQSSKVKVFENNDLIYSYVPYSTESGYVQFTANKASFLNTIIASAYTSGYKIPSIQYFTKLDADVLQMAANAGALETGKTFDVFTQELTLNDTSNGKWCVNPYVESDGTETPIELTNEQGKGNSILRKYGSLKFAGSDEEKTIFNNLDSLINQYKGSNEEGLGIDGCPSADFLSLYKTQMTSKISSLRSCIATRDGTFGHYGVNNDWKVEITQKDWGYAWSKGLLEGLLVYPVSYLVDTIAFNLDPALTGWGQLVALVIVTLIVRGIMLAATFKNTLSQQKMQELQPQLAKIQQKYPNSNTNQAEKQRLAQEQMMLYKRNKINPASTFIVLLFQFPIFICVWAALQGSAALSTGSFLNLALSDTIKDVVFNVSGDWYTNSTGWWTALILFILMAGAQIVSMLIPQLIAKKKQKNVVKTTANPAADAQGKSTKTFMVVMMGMTIVMGFFLPSAMGVYWLIGALISILQTGITQIVLKNKKKK